MRRASRQTLNGSADYAFVIDNERKIRGFVCRDAIGQASPQINLIECIQRTTPLDDVVSRVVCQPRSAAGRRGGRIVLRFGQQDERPESTDASSRFPCLKSFRSAPGSITAFKYLLDHDATVRSMPSARSSRASPRSSNTACKPFQCGLLMALFVGIGLWRVGWRFALFVLLALLLIYSHRASGTRWSSRWG